MPEQGPTPALCCSYCGKPASCIGKADDGHGWAYACDECCGHGNEDSCCYPLSRIPAEWNRRDEVEEKAEKEEDAARARHLREAVEGLSPDNMERLSRSLVTAYRRAADAREDRLGRADGRAVEDKTLHLRRAALLAALGGTTPPLDETGGKA